MPGVIKQYQKDGSIKYVFKSCLSTYEEGLLSQAKYGLLGRCFITETDEMFVFDHRFYIFHNIDLNTGIVRRFSGYHRNNWPDNYRNRFLKDGSKDNASFHEIRSIVHDPFHNRLVFVDNGRIRSVSLKDGSVSIIANLNEYTEHDNVSVTVNPDTGEIYGMNHHVDEAIYRIEDGKKILIFRQKPYNPYYNDNTLEKLRLNADYLYFHKKTGMLLLPADKSYSYLSPEGVTFQGPTRTPFQIFALDLHSQSDSKAIQRLVINYPDDFSNIYAAYAILVEPNGDLIVDHGSTLSRVTFPNGRMMLTDTPYDIGYDYKN
ncbi:MAG: hypothetical protein CVV27_07830 [Candidatus Melainabacteria bacterium HGW-Melainabacteria-1]|nr:MAG: hypothetical protein CVV27_07830 [Candidatus Melainabacteria bacterium HGW-Melainabacteria-1]